MIKDFASLVVIVSFVGAFIVWMPAIASLVHSPVTGCC